MDTILQAFLSWQFLAFALAIGAVVFVIRQIVEYWMENAWPLKQWKQAHKDSRLWRGLILPILPVLLGVVGAYVGQNYPYPEGFATTAGRVAFGLVAGFTSGMFVRLYKSFLASKTVEFSEKVSSFVKSQKGESHKHDEECDKDLEQSVRDSIKQDQ